jgi:hypothetical protein
VAQLGLLLVQLVPLVRAQVQLVPLALLAQLAQLVTTLAVVLDPKALLVHKDLPATLVIQVSQV